MPRESKVLVRLRELRIFNCYDFYQDKSYIYRSIGGGRSVIPSHWAVVKLGVSLSTFWADYGSKSFVYSGREDSKRALLEAQKWASERFGVGEWIRDPYGSYGSKTYVEERLKELLGGPK